MEVVACWQAHLKVGGDVAHQCGCAVGHGFEQGNRQTLVRRGEDIAAGVVEQGLQSLALDEAGEDDAMLLGHSFELVRVAVFEVRVACDDELESVIVDLGEGLNQMMQILFGRKAAHAEYVFARLDAEVAEVGRVGHVVRLGHTIIDKVHLVVDVILLAKQFLDAFADDDDLIGKGCAHGLAKAEHELGHPVPFDTVVVLSVMGEHHLHAQQAGDGGEDGWSAGMYMQDMGMQAFGLPDGTPGMDDGFEALAARRIDVDQLDALPVVLMVVDVAGTAYYRDIVAHVGQAGKQLLAMRFDTTHDVRDASCACDYNAVFDMSFLHYIRRFVFMASMVVAKVALTRVLAYVAPFLVQTGWLAQK